VDKKLDLIKLTLFFSQSGNKLFRRNGANLLLLSGNAVKEVSQTGEKGLLGPFIARLVLQDLVPERLAEVQCLEHRIAVASIAELENKTLLHQGF